MTEQEIIDYQTEQINRLEEKIADLQHKVDTLQGFLDHDIEYDMDKTIQEQKNKIAELEQESNKLLDVINNQDVKIADLEKDKAYLDESLDKQIQATLDLQKENKELKSELTKKADTNHSLVEQMADLESENAELEAKNEANENGAKKYAEFYFKTNDQLAQAKEIIKKCVHILKHSGTTLEWNDVIGQAEQFLKEIEK